MDHLNEARNLTERAMKCWSESADELAGQVHAQAATAHALIALVERLDKITTTLTPATLEAWEQVEDAHATYLDQMDAYPEKGDAAV